MPLPITLEVGHSAINGEQHAHVIELINARRRLPITAEIEQLAVALQAFLWHGGLVRAAGVNDLVIAATAIVHGAVVLHYDADYEHIARVSELTRSGYYRADRQPELEGLVGGCCCCCW